MDQPTSIDVLRAVLDPVRLAVLGDAASGAVSLSGVAERMNITHRDVAEAVGYLRNVGLLDDDAALVRSALRAVGRDLPKEHADLGRPIPGPWSDDEALVLGRFFDGDRLVELPQSAAKRRLVLEKIALTFEPGRRYAERDVNFVIQLVYADYAVIRRYLVEEGFMDRADGSYWRTGGRYEVPPQSAAPTPHTIPTEIHGIELRPYRADMASALVAAANDERIARFMSDQFPYPYTMEAATAWIERASLDDPPLQFATFVDGTLAGGLGGFLGTAERTGSCEIGWWLNPDYWGRGITSGAVRALIDELFTTHELMRLWAPVMHPNRASARVAEKAGMRFEGVAPSAYLKAGVRYDQLNYGLTREQWAGGRDADMAEAPSNGDLSGEPDGSDGLEP